MTFEFEENQELIERVKEGKKDISEGRFIEGDVEDIMRAIEDELNSIK